MKKVVVVGAGIIGLSVAYHLHKSGCEVTIIDRNPEGDKTSFGNAGSIAVMEINPAASPGVIWKIPRWLFDPLGPLSLKPTYFFNLIPWLFRFYKTSNNSSAEQIQRALTSINSRVYEDLLPMFEDIGILHKLHRQGSLVVYESDAGYEADKALWQSRRKFGIEATYLNSKAAKQLEPSLGENIRHAVLATQASFVSDPKEIVDDLRQWLVKQGVVVITGEVKAIGASAASPQIILATGQTLYSDDIVIAAGAWSRFLVEQLGEKTYVESERGYNTTLPHPNVRISREIIFAEKKFVITPLSCGLRIGGTAEFGGIDNPPNFKRATVLTTLAKKYLPGLNTDSGKPWAGHRPSTPDSLPIIGPSAKHAHLYYAFGHGHLGLTQSATTGRIITDILLNRAPVVEIAPYSISRFNK